MLRGNTRNAYDLGYKKDKVIILKNGKILEFTKEDARETDEYISKKLIFATGIKDIMPDIKGFAECWGTSVIHCPYCHGYEVKRE